MKHKDLNKQETKAMPYDALLAIVYSDGKDYSHLRKSAYYIDPEYGCNQCGSTLVTEMEEADICHDCGFVYS